VVFTLVGSVNSAKSLSHRQLRKLASRCLFPSRTIEKRWNFEAINRLDLFHKYPVLPTSLRFKFQSNASSLMHVVEYFGSYDCHAHFVRACWDWWHGGPPPSISVG